MTLDKFELIVIKSQEKNAVSNWQQGPLGVGPSKSAWFLGWNLTHVRKLGGCGRDGFRDFHPHDIVLSTRKVPHVLQSVLKTH